MKFCKEYQAVYDAFTIKPDIEEAMDLDRRYRNVINKGIWDKLDCFYIYDNKCEKDNLINWKEPKY